MRALAVSPALANDAVLSFNALLVLLLALALLAVIRMPPWTGSVADDADDQLADPGDPAGLPGPPPGAPGQHAAGQHAPAHHGLAQHAPGQHAPGQHAVGSSPARAPGQAAPDARPASGPPPLPEGTWRPVVSGGPPWGPAPRPPGLRP